MESNNSQRTEKGDSQMPPAVRSTFTVDEAAEYLGLSRASMYLHLRSGKFPARRLGARYIISRVACERWLEMREDEDPWK